MPVVVNATAELGVSNTSGAWLKLFKNDTLSRTGVRIRVQSDASAPCWVALQPRGEGQPAGLTEKYIHREFVQTETFDFGLTANGAVEFWITGGSNGATKVSAWELVGP